MSGVDESRGIGVAGVRARLALALDVADPRTAVAMARSLAPVIGVAKVGLELWALAGPAVVGELREAGLEVFCDLKCHDIPTTVERAARAVGALGARWLTVHGAGGRAMVEAAVSGFSGGAEAATSRPARSGGLEPGVLAVTVLTSAAEAEPAVLLDRAAMAAEAGCAGIVAAATDLPLLARVAPALLRVVPGIRPAGVGVHDQARVATPATAIEMGADVLVLGRAVTRAPDPLGAARAIAAEVAGALDGRGDGPKEPGRASPAR